MLNHRILLVILAALSVSSAPLPAQISRTEYAQRRSALAARLQDGVILALGAREPEHDYLAFFQNESFKYLTGYDEPNASLVMVKRGSQVSSMLFVDRRDPAQEVWSGKRFGPEGATASTGIPARPVDELGDVLDSLFRTTAQLYVVAQGQFGARAERTPRVLTRDEQVVRLLTASHASMKVASANQHVQLLRARKSAAELDLIRKAAAITVEAQREAMRAMEPGMNEFEIQALIEYTFRRNGADRPSFATIVASGPNSTTLHYNADDRFMNAGEVVVMDVGASYRGYAADVTRTLPVSGTFTADQRAIYQIVRDAQSAAERQAKVGARASLMSDSAIAVIASGLARLGLIESPAATYDCGPSQQPQQCSQVQLYFMHGLGHGIGLEVHDPEQYYFSETIGPGSAYTIEPGIYVRENLLEILRKTARNDALIAKIRPAVERYRNIGIRIEDDYVVTEQGVEWVSRAPREITEVEAMMRETIAGVAKRDSAKVDWYRRTGGPRTP
ncbi:MAG TPA: Xaa-Pro aminopeptidase [Gemmatimonadaceae bacterium]|nr:Xaa-Pro aminopeptidase [Gemmatimonadaceae bacterium]